MPESEFTYHYSIARESYVLRAPLSIPLCENVVEYTARLASAHNIPCYLHEELEKSLRDFVNEEERKYADSLGQGAIDEVKAGNKDVKPLIDRWTKAFSQETVAHCKQTEPTNDVVFSEVYHSLIHSSALSALLRQEQKYALSMMDMISERDKDLAHLEQRHATEMEQAVKSLGISFSDEEINQLAQRHFDSTQMIESKWASQISMLRNTQKHEYRQWVMKVYEDMQSNPTTPHNVHEIKLTGYNDVRTSSANMTSASSSDHRLDSVIPVRREESFTVHLGAQMKTMHNLCLVSTDTLNLCKHKLAKDGGGWVTEPQRLQTAISLYSDSLSALVMLVDNRLNSYTGIKREFAKVCEQSTDFHFPDLEQQFEDIEHWVSQGSVCRASQKQTNDEGDKVSVHSSGSISSSEREDKNAQLQPGDFYITRHSNLAQVHAVFHLVTDDSVRSSVSDVSSRHPVILGIRNILKACFRYDITTIALPLLLVHEMAEEMTIPWCLKRAELILKCVKGFMMELATWSGQKSCTIQFLVPRMLSDETLSSISAMIPSIFRMSNPVVHKTSNNTNNKTAS